MADRPRHVHAPTKPGWVLRKRVTTHNNTPLAAKLHAAQQKLEKNPWNRSSALNAMPLPWASHSTTAMKMARRKFISMRIVMRPRGQVGFIILMYGCMYRLYGG